MAPIEPVASFKGPESHPCGPKTVFRRGRSQGPVLPQNFTECLRSSLHMAFLLLMRQSMHF